jgi:two-component system OmpR family response regulator
MKILLLEDDPVLADIITDFLEEHYGVDHAHSSKSALELAEKNRYDLYIFDINVPGVTGIDLLRELRAFSDHTPAILITAYQDTAHLKRGFDAGAEDYIRKPFDLEELAARIENIRRHRGFEAAPAIAIDEKRSFDRENHAIRTGKGSVTITPKESELLDYLIRHKARVVSAEELSQNLWEFESMPSEATIRGYIKTLRKAVGSEHILTIRGRGYRFE